MGAEFKNYAEFERKYTAIGLQRGRLFKWVTFFVCVYSLYLDLILSGDSTIDLLYRQTLLAAHIAALVLSLAYIAAYRLLEKSRLRRFPWAAKACLLSDMFLSLLTAAVLSLNSQRFTGNIDTYVMMALAIALVIPLYPRWVLRTYAFVHALFMIGLSSLYHDSTIPVKLFNATTLVLVAYVLYAVLYASNVKSFLNEEMLKEDKATFAKLLEINPFPLMIAKFDDGKIQYANRRAIRFYEIADGQLDALRHQDLYKNGSDADIIHSILKTDGTVNDYIAEQKTLSGKIRCPVVNYELIDYFGEKSILFGVADIGEIKRVEHELTIHASVDALTGVFNRRVGMDFVKKRHALSARENKGFILCFIDIDNLKMVNDHFGHLEGDSLIADVCKTIKGEIQPNDLLFRYGGDEFMILFNGDDDQETRSACRRIAQKFDAINNARPKPYPINASMGIFCYKPEMRLDLDQIIEIVDKNMYVDKLRKKQP